MKYVLFATAGHVDHGKTSLIRALTGIDTDRLPEEKRRGLSIDIGIAYIDFPEVNTRLELIDVPGHERFLRNAIAGLCSVSGVLLVVDVNEGVMPQTVEHLRIAKGFGVREGVAVLTKVDRAEEDILELAEEELRNFLKEEGMDMPIVKVSSLTGEGIEDLKRELLNVLRKVELRREEIPLRIFVDSAFVVRGYGTVLKGSCVEGEVREGEKVVLEPLGVVSRVRRIQNHGEFVKKAVAGERVALNLPEVDVGKVERGFWVLKPDSYEKSRNILVETDLDLKPSRFYLFFFGMREVMGKVSPLEENVFILRLGEEVVSRRGDRIVILSSSAEFLGSAKVLHPKPKIKKKFIKENLGLLKESFELFLLKESGYRGVNEKSFIRLTGRSPVFQVLEREGIKLGEVFYSKEVLSSVERKLREMLSEEFSRGVFGVDKEKLREKLSINDSLFEYILERLGNYRMLNEYIVDEKRSDLIKSDEFIRLMDLLKDRIREEGEVISEGIPKEVLSLAVRKGHVHRIGDSLLISDEFLKECVRKLRSLGETFSVQEAKHTLGLTRKYLIPLLEHLDFLNLTVREGSRRRWKR